MFSVPAEVISSLWLEPEHSIAPDELVWFALANPLGMSRLALRRAAFPGALRRPPTQRASLGHGRLQERGEGVGVRCVCTFPWLVSSDGGESVSSWL